MKRGDAVVWPVSGMIRHAVLLGCYDNASAVKISWRGCEWILKPNEVEDARVFEERRFGEEKKEAREILGFLIDGYNEGLTIKQIAEAWSMSARGLNKQVEKLKRLGLLNEKTKKV